jgi:hypothetical protein
MVMCLGMDVLLHRCVRGATEPAPQTLAPFIASSSGAF